MEDNPKITKQDLQKIKTRLYDRADKLADRAVRVYMVLRWKWHDNDRTPTTLEIRRAAYELIDTLEPNHNSYYASSGGLTARYFQRVRPNDDEVWWEGEIKFEMGKMELIRDHRDS